jgi:hypothetical protein
MCTTNFVVRSSASIRFRFNPDTWIDSQTEGAASLDRPMKLQDLLGWMEIGARLAIASPKRFAEISRTLRETLDAAEIIAAFDDQLFLRKERPTKRYLA